MHISQQGGSWYSCTYYVVVHRNDIDIISNRNVVVGFRMFIISD
jgi:hypothetical protein